MIMYIPLLLVLLFATDVHAGDTQCQYDCLARGGMPEICNDKCGFKAPPGKYDTDGRFNPEAGKEKKYFKYEPDPSEEAEEEEVIDLRQNDRDRYALCIGRCTVAGNLPQDCETLCSHAQEREQQPPSSAE